MSIATALVTDPLPYRIVGSQKETITDVTFDSSYPTGGEAITPADLSLNRIDSATCEIKTVGGTVNVANAHYDEVNSKIVVYDETPAEVGNGNSLATLVVRVKARGG